MRTERLRVRQEQSAPHVTGLETSLREERAGLSRIALLGDGRICLTNNAAERSLRGSSLAPNAPQP
jgi:hypothetical protein